MIDPPKPRETSPLRCLTWLLWAALVPAGGGAAAALALGWLSDDTSRWALLATAGGGGMAAIAGAAAALDKRWFCATAFLTLLSIADAAPALVLPLGAVAGRGDSFFFMLPTWLGTFVASLFLSRPDAWADGYEWLSGLPLLLPHVPLAAVAAASWLPIGTAALAALGVALVGTLGGIVMACFITDGALRLLTLGLLTLGASSLLLRRSDSPSGVPVPTPLPQAQIAVGSPPPPPPPPVARRCWTRSSSFCCLPYSCFIAASSSRICRTDSMLMSDEAESSDAARNVVSSSMSLRRCASE